MKGSKEQKMTSQKDLIADSQLCELVFVLSQKRDQPINPNARDPETNQVIYTKRQESDRDTDDDEKSYNRKIDDLIRWSNEIAKGISPALNVLRVPNRELNFRGNLGEEPLKRRSRDPQAKQKNFAPAPRSHGAYTFIPAKVVRGNIDEDAGGKPEQFVDSPEMAELIMRLDRAFEGQPLSGDGIELTVSPNWVCTPGSERGGTGGLADIPRPYRGRSDEAHPFDFSYRPGLKEALEKGGEGVTVAILDTAPSLKALTDIYERYHKVDPQKQKEHHPLIESLLRPDGPLMVHPASHEELLRMRAIHVKDHDYDMSDHGLFIAGIIHSIAPKAKIHLYEVLNSQGVGDLMSIAHGFLRVLNSFPGQLLVVNSSLTFRCPRLNHPISELEPAFMAKIIKDGAKLKDVKRLTPELLTEDGKEWLARQGAVIEWICDQLYHQGSRVIAAAGNDWGPESFARPDPGLPAGFNSVLGVAALPKNALPNSAGFYPVSKYSNLSDKPEPGSTEKEVGVVTLGGEAGEGNGVLGVYIGQFPDMQYRLDKYPWVLRPIMWVLFTLAWGNNVGPRNKSHWAWWCGTSFATPIITGLTAAMLSTLSQPASTQDAIDKMYDLDIIRQNLTSDHEDGVEGVRQL
jgi:hypothetical protein